jgi:DNA repair exonuclease SbcCD ATPase subunit
MKLKEIAIRGFRGFNELRSIPIDERLTLISASNSHGKTSISEGFEWLLYGFTSKVALADSKDEYRGSYRNVHLLQPEAPTVKVVVQEGASTSELQATLSGSDAVLRVDGKVVPSWPFSVHLEKSPKPFILQHALKDLLLAAPVDRFNRFAGLLGFDELTQVHKDLMAFCTKPPLPGTARSLIADVDGLVLKVEADSQLAPIAKSIRKGYSHLSSTRSLTRKHTRGLVPPKTAEMNLLPALLKQRDEAISKIFTGTVAVAAFTREERAALEAEEMGLLTRVTSEAVALFTELVKAAAQHRILREARFHDLGVELLRQGPLVCPFCQRDLTDADVSHISEYHNSLVEKKQAAAGLEQTQSKLQALLTDLNQRISDYYKRIAGRTKGLLEVQDRIAQLQILLAGEHERHATAIANAIQELGKLAGDFVESGKTLRSSLDEAQSSLHEPFSGLTVVEKLGEALVRYIAVGRAIRGGVTNHSQALDLAQKVLTEQVIAAAGTRTIDLTIELLENDHKIEKRMRLAVRIDGLKELKTNVDVFVTKIMLDAISGELADEVMEWYKRIRTVGDPNVHFAGFDMKKTPQGGRVQIKASSYGKDLVSAVSSLSESKLNALGLCITIAVNLKEQSPFEFLIIDDPIQSWDKDHEIQFIGVIRELVERRKQVVLLSHNNEWIKQVRAACADLNGLYYEITGYTESGPIITLLPWIEPKQRLQTILAIIEDQSADSIRLQQAEEELRQVLHQYACMLYEAVKGTPKNPATLNADKVRKILTECGLPIELVNKVMTIFETLDDAHHAAPDYSPNRQKLRQYYEIALRLSQAVNTKLKEDKAISIVTTGKTA